MTGMRDPDHPKGQAFAYNSVVPGEKVGSSNTAKVNGEHSANVCTNNCNEHNDKSIRKFPHDNLWSLAQTILCLAVWMIIDSGISDPDQRSSKSSLHCVRNAEKNVETKQPDLRRDLGSERSESMMTEDISELIRRLNLRVLQQLTTEETAISLKNDLVRQEGGFQLQKDLLQSQSRLTEDSSWSRQDDKTFFTTRRTLDDSHSSNTSNNDPPRLKFYPETVPAHRSHPRASDFSVADQGPIGKALVTHRSWQQGDFMARFDGMTVPEVMLHTLQKTSGVHLWDPHFIGNLAHSCNPNVMLDMVEHEMWAIQDIEPDTILSMDYSSTEDYLYRTFECGCTAPGCRGEVTGRKQRRGGCAGVSSKSI